MKCDPGWHFNQLVETKELIETATVLGIVLSRLVRGCYCEIIVCVSEKNNFFALLIKIGKFFFHLTEGTNGVTWWPMPRNDKIRLAPGWLNLYTNQLKTVSGYIIPGFEFYGVPDIKRDTSIIASPIKTFLLVASHRSEFLRVLRIKLGLIQSKDMNT